MKKLRPSWSPIAAKLQFVFFVPVTKWESEQLRSTVKKIPYPSIASAPMSLI